MDKKKMNIAYERLSRDDEQQGESFSITNQKTLLENYAKQNGIEGLVHMTDDGWSGTRWDRPAITKLIDEVDAENVGIVIVKDMSRLGRDHLRVGLLLEKFRERDVRFIAINDNVDTDKGIDDFTPFRNIINEWVARDTSRKIRAINELRIKEGKHVTGAVPYGYLRNPDISGEWIIDGEAAAIVRRMFKCVIDGKSVTQIAEELTAEGVLIPSAHWEKIGAGMRRYPNAHPTKWATATVIEILGKAEYMGWAVLNKSIKETYKSKRRRTSQDEWLIFKDAHPQIVDEETWNVVQRLRGTKRHQQRNGGNPNPLTGVLYCADCGHKMHHKTGLTWGNRKPHDEYVCSSYRHYSRSCTYHYIRTKVVEDLILSAIRRISRYVRQNEAEFIERVRGDSIKRIETAIRENRKKKAEVKRRLDEISVLVKKLYEAFATDTIPKNHFTELLKGYDEELETLNAEIARLTSVIDGHNADTVKADRFIAIVKRHTDFPEFSATLLNEFIEKVIVHEGDKSSGKRVQKVDIYMNFIGRFDVPVDEAEPPAEEAKPKRHPYTEKDREYDRRRYAKVRDARIAAEQTQRAEILKGTSFEDKAG